ncbi:MAG: cytochrome c biogenesis protein [Pseudobdellovibrionaceae bacterium]
MKWIISLLIPFFMIPVAQADPLSALKSLPVQDGGRVKPLDTFAREHLELVYGKYRYEGRPAVEIVMTWILQPQAWVEKEIVQIKNSQVKQGLRLEAGRKLFTLNEITNNDRLGLLMQELQAKRETKEKLDPYYQALQRLENQVLTFREIAAGRMLKLVPPKDLSQGSAWLDLTRMTPEHQAAFLEVTKSFVAYLEAVAKGHTPNDQQLIKAMEDSVYGFEKLARAENPEAYPTENKINVEMHYNAFHPFKWAYLAYLFSVIAILLSWISRKDGFYAGAWVLALVGFALNIYGFALRTYLTERAPVTNMYETVIWVGFGTVFFAMIFEYMYRWRFILLSGGIIGFFCLVLGEMAPIVLDNSLTPLEPVLRDNFWLTTHVLTITISYAAFFLSFAIGNVALYYFIKGEDNYKDKIKAMTLAQYRGIQVGVSLLAPGIVLGGIWADYSWGRFWGWDPKETWALIALLGYIAVLHGRIAGLIKDFGMAVSSILTFTLIIMAWYGVNFVLGAGLHSYGFGAGGVEYVSAFVAAHVLWVVFATVVRNGKLKKIS